MAYRKPPLFARRVFNPIAMRFAISNSKTLTVRGRLSGQEHRVPVIPVELQGSRYLVSPRGEADWVRNLRAAGGRGELRTGRGDVEQFQATEVPAADRGPVLAAYQEAAGRAVASHFKALPDPADHPVFHIASREDDAQRGPVART